MSWQTQKNKHSLSPAMKYTLSNRAVPFWIHRVGKSKAQNKQHSDLALSVITVCDRLERASSRPAAKTRALIGTIPRPQRSSPFNREPLSTARSELSPTAGDDGQAGACKCVYVPAMLAGVCALVFVLTCSRFQSRISAMPKYLFSSGPACLKKMSGFRIKSLSGGI